MSLWIAIDSEYKWTVSVLPEVPATFSTRNHVEISRPGYIKIEHWETGNKRIGQLLEHLNVRGNITEPPYPIWSL